MKTPRLLLAVSLLLVLALPAPAAEAGADHPPKVIKQVPPHYTAEMRKSRPKGVVIVAFVVDEQGAVVQATVQKSLSPAADQAALDSVRQWTFEPAAKGGRPVKTRTQVPIVFK